MLHAKVTGKLHRIGVKVSGLKCTPFPHLNSFLIWAWLYSDECWILPNFLLFSYLTRNHTKNTLCISSPSLMWTIPLGCLALLEQHMCWAESESAACTLGLSLYPGSTAERSIFRQITWALYFWSFIRWRWWESHFIWCWRVNEFCWST
jgi:hypothetical protein